MSVYAFGTDVDCKNEIRIYDNNALYDPDTLIAKVTKPDRTITNYTYGQSSNLIRLSQGIFRLRLNVDQAGKWAVEWTSDGVAKGVTKQYFDVSLAGN